ncbi:MAG: PDZ domain-containing protein [Planctomycetota bacterium]|nr:PDZ domain-containing protein [Planctomycetota bacterium]MDA1250892.1 PDZ domain-containing protein [Planctomycetota bacterium]
MKLRSSLTGLSIALLLAMSVLGQEEPPKKLDEPTDAKPAIPDRADSGDAATPAATTEEITAWVAQLSSRNFQDREAATKKLSSAGPAAAAAVAKAAAEGPVEVGLRAVAILDAHYKSEDGSTIDGAEAGLLQLKTAKHAGVARRAAETLTRHYPIRQDRAVVQIREFGGQIQFDRFFGRNRAPGLPEHGAVHAVAIGPDWTGGEKGLEQVSRLDSLSTVYLLNGHELSEKSIAELQKQLPQMTIQRRGAAFLGVGTQNDALGCLIGEVKVNSAAARGDLRGFDIVIAFGGKPILGANDLIEAITLHQPGETVKLVVLRDYDRGFLMRQALVEMIHDEDEFHPLAALAMMANMRVELEITLEKWNLGN